MKIAFVFILVLTGMTIAQGAGLPEGINLDDISAKGGKFTTQFRINATY